MSGSRIDPRLARVLELHVEAETLLDSGRAQEGRERLQEAARLLADYMDVDLAQWREQSEFLP